MYRATASRRPVVKQTQDGYPHTQQIGTITFERVNVGANAVIAGIPTCRSAKQPMREQAIPRHGGGDCLPIEAGSLCDSRIVFLNDHVFA